MYTLWIANKTYSSWSLRPWLLLKALNIAFNEQLSYFEHGKSSREKFRAFSPSGLVPCLIDGNTTVWDSLAIAEYIAEDHAQVWPSDKTARAWARSSTAEMHSGFATIRSMCPMNCLIRTELDEITPELQSDIDRIDALWSEGLTRFSGEWLAGDTFTAVDAFYAPVAFRAKTYGLKFSAISQGWIDRMLKLPAMVEWVEAAEKELKINH
ncbi:glutathione S-transferase family protein [Xenorhabdus nematophila]|uniref:Glutathione S-transferase n=1 Tax=Xenorhabdus nematophila (strain ATCC 19061 / DSM 3370 / CCUG 14189 / LMG 1036 / NCIMB 9965 / AN6) TaxID=406817 RepID=D3V9Q7_XENNA|nr:glutathione S-transferase family protein [Xenorhabdus nematophila]CEE95003.1 putative glutathione S-transferase [Xenorhabdus nematophila str. Anatoliense]CEF29271.1 putative glutathione S-transferase [Xenorhabdus nematophila str. Websteri]AYA39532.1 glutathione S-transferase family protein [Xenorhabdus nematophila]KHD28933.1 glutathione S-transferase [Xenorhabdus nematophila]MBA0018094.1 glutathione S-transferase family protein [Xenorhabdus nematophila]